MPYGEWINDLPTGFFLAVHLGAFVLGAGFGLAFKRELGLGRSKRLAAAAASSFGIYTRPQ